MTETHLPDPRAASGVTVVRSDRIRRERGTGLAAPELPRRATRPPRSRS